jgi:ABC-type transporter Mla maintaining outer membrane lipid asymmetry permease subunit MlaE
MSNPQTDPAPMERSVKKPSWRRAFALAAGVIYMPQLVMCLYTLAFVSCAHCKKAVGMVAPLAPGVFCYQLAQSLTGFTHHFTGSLGVVLTAAVLAIVAAGRGSLAGGGADRGVDRFLVACAGHLRIGAIVS